MSGTVAAPEKSTLAEAARRVPASFYQFRLFPSGAFGIPFASADFAARLGVVLEDPGTTAANFFARVHPDDVPRIKAEIARSARTFELFECEFRFRLPSGAELWIEARSNPERAPDGGVLWNGIATDLTARKASEAALRESENLLRLFVEHAPAALAMFDRDLRYLAYSRRWLSDYGLDDKEILGLSHYEVFPEITERWKELHRRGLAGEVLSDEEDRFDRADGSVQWLKWEVRPWWTDARQVGGIVMITEDITARRRAAEELRASKEQFQTVFDLAPVGVSQTDPETTRYVAVNRRMCEITGYSEDELLTMRVSDITHPEDRERDHGVYQRVLQAGATPQRIEKRFVRKNGSTAWVNVNVRILPDAAGRPARTLAMIEDITERKEAEARFSRLNAELENAFEWQRQIFEGSRDAVFLSDESGRFAAVNQAATELTGYSREELLAMSIPDLHDESDLAAYRAFHPRILGGERILSDAPIRRKDGKKVAVEFNNSLVVIGGRRLVHTAGRDVTERARSAAALAASDARYRILFENTTEGIIAIDPDTHRFLFQNPAVCAMFGYSPEEFLRLELSDIHPGDVLEGIRTDIASAAPGERPKVQILPCIRKGGSTFQAEVRGSTVELEGRRVGFAFFTDITERLRLEEELRQAHKMHAIGQLAGGVAHDFNNLLTVISGNCDLILSESDASDPRRGSFADIRAASDRASALTRQLLAFSRKQILEPRVLDLHEAVIGIEKMLRRLIGEDVDLTTDLKASRSWVKVDPGQFEQVVMNLVVNARDAMPRGGRITIRTRNVDTANPIGPGEIPAERPPWVALSISDTGPGIPTEARPHLFEPFFTTKGIGKGTGLGLATVYGIVTQSGGEIGVESEPGKGATFTVFLPSQRAPRELSGSKSFYGTLPRGTETVLVVEDEDAVRRIVKVVLESTGYRVLEARSGNEAIEAAKTHPGGIQIVLTDVVMPGMGGRELAERIERDHPGVKVLYMSGYTDDAIMRHGIAAGGAFLQKPFTPLGLTKKVREVLDSGS